MSFPLRIDEIRDICVFKSGSIKEGVSKKWMLSKLQLISCLIYVALSESKYTLKDDLSLIVQNKVHL